MDAGAAGACAILRGRACWRWLGRDPIAMIALIRSMCLSVNHTGTRAQVMQHDLKSNVVDLVLCI